MNYDCSNIEILINKITDNEISNNEKTILHNHISNCNLCKKQFAFYNGLSQMLAISPSVNSIPFKIPIKYKFRRFFSKVAIILLFLSLTIVLIKKKNNNIKPHIKHAEIHNTINPPKIPIDRELVSHIENIVDSFAKSSEMIATPLLTQYSLMANDISPYMEDLQSNINNVGKKLNDLY